MTSVLIVVNWFLVVGLLVGLGFWGLYAFPIPKVKHARGVVVVGLLLAVAIGYQGHRSTNDVLYMTNDASNTWRLYNPWGFSIKTIEPGDLRIVSLGTVSEDIKFNSSSQIMLPGDSEMVTPHKVVKAGWEVLTITTEDGSWEIKDPPSALHLGYGHTESVLYHAGYMLPEHRFTGRYWDVPRMHQTEWLKTGAKVGTSCWAYSGVSWWPAKIVAMSDEYGVKVTYDPKVTAKWVSLGPKSSAGFDEWVPPYRLAPATADMPTRLPDLNK